MPKSRGFTLIELMITVVVIGVLAAIAYPSYTQYVIRANRGEAQAYLMELAQRQQQFLMDSRTYASDIDDLGVVEPPSVGRNYDVSLSDVSATPPTFTLTASPKAGTMQAGDGDLTVDQSGAKQWEGGAW